MKDKDEAKRENEEAGGSLEEEIERDIGVAEHDLERLQADLDKARAEAADYLDNLKRLKAEFENFRKRMLREQSEFLKLAAEGLITALLPVIDNFERAMAHEIHGGQIDEYKNGMQLVYNQIMDTLAKEGLSAIEPIGEPFDPTSHEAMMKVESKDHPEGTVVSVLEKGYFLKGRVIRPAKVAVAG